MALAYKNSSFFLLLFLISPISLFAKSPQMCFADEFNCKNQCFRNLGGANCIFQCVAERENCLNDAKNSYKQSSSTSREINQPYSNTGQACISVQSLGSKNVTSTRGYHVFTSENGLYYDILHQFEATNLCNARMNFIWKFPNSKFNGKNSQILSPGQKTVVSCRQALARCDGQIDYSWKSTRY